MQKGLVRIKRALISVSNKQGIVELAQVLKKYRVEILSTGGTAKTLKDAGIPVKEVSSYTEYPEMLEGRVKTLHPKIHAGLLALRNNPEHMKQIKEQGIGTIDLVAVNLYPFEETIKKPDVKLEEAIENIDIGGPSMLRSAAKNYQGVAVTCNPERYKEIIKELRKNKGETSLALRRSLTEEVFYTTSLYDRAIYNYLSSQFLPPVSIFPALLNLSYKKIQDLRYGENPHQKAAFYAQVGLKEPSLVSAGQLHGKELSFNNILDLNAALELAREFQQPTAIIIKHTNPCGAASGKNILFAYTRAYECDPLSAFGSIVGLNRKVDLSLAERIASTFVEAVLAPEFTPSALKVLKKKENVRLLKIDPLYFKKTLRGEGVAGNSQDTLDIKKVSGGIVAQEKDLAQLDPKGFRIVTNIKPTSEDFKSLLFAWRVAKHVKSNAIVLAKESRTVGIGAGQMSRVDAVIIAIRKAARNAKGAVLASDAFFPKPDAIEEAAKVGIKAIMQPGGSLHDKEIINACNKYKIAMIFTGIRHFRH